LGKEHKYEYNGTTGYPSIDWYLFLLKALSSGTNNVVSIYNNYYGGKYD
jgi:hypothetical protein